METRSNVATNKTTPFWLLLLVFDHLIISLLACIENGYVDDNHNHYQLPLLVLDHLIIRILGIMISMLLKMIIIIMIIILVKVDDNQYGDHNGGEFIHLWEAALCG